MEADTDDSEVKNVSTPIITEFNTKSIDMSPSGQFPDCTPLLDTIENDLLKRQYTLRTYDSGFSEWTDSASVASLNETPRLRDLSPSIYSTPSSFEVDSLSHVSSSEFQRNLRRSWPLKSRKLSFVSPDPLSSPESTLQLKLEDENHYGHSANNLVLVPSEDENTFMTRSVDIDGGKGGLLSRVLHRSRSCSRSPVSSSSDDLENSFQEMSLEESSSDSTPQSPTPLISSSSPVFSFRHLHKSHKVVVEHGASPYSPSEPQPVNDGSSISSEEIAHTYQPCQNLTETSIDSSRITFLPSEKLSRNELDNGVDTHSIQRLEPAVTATSLSSSTSLHESTSHHPSTGKFNFSLRKHTSVALDTQPNSLLRPHNFDNDRNLVCDINYISLLPSNFIKSPSKRSCNISQDVCSDSVSPVKMRKLQSGATTSVLDIDASKQDLFGCGKDSLYDVLNSLPTTKKGRDQYSVSVRSSDDRMPQFLNIDSALDLSEESELNSVEYLVTPVRRKFCKAISLKERSEVNDASLVQRICHKFSPPCPSQLIGRHVGVKTFDIIGGLKQHNLIGCVEMVLAYIPDCDLVKIVEVNEIWKSALYDEMKALRRYKSLLKKLNSPRKARNQDGKENMSDKGLKENILMTMSTGLLASIQPQTVRSDIPHLVSSPQHPDLQCGDLVRNCPHCQCRAIVQPAQDRAICLSEKCAYDFCTKCFFPFHHSTPCKPLFHSASKTTLAGTKKSKKNLKRLKTL